MHVKCSTLMCASSRPGVPLSNLILKTFLPRYKKVCDYMAHFDLDFLCLDEISISTVNVTDLDQTKMLIQVAVRSIRG